MDLNMFVFTIIIFIVLFSAVLIMSWSLGLLLAHGKCEKLFSRWGGRGECSQMNVCAVPLLIGYLYFHCLLCCGLQVFPG